MHRGYVQRKAGHRQWNNRFYQLVLFLKTGRNGVTSREMTSAVEKIFVVLGLPWNGQYGSSLILSVSDNDGDKNQTQNNKPY